MKVNPKRYKLFGWDYEYINSLTDEEVAWYVKFALKAGGPVLELACGTARLLVSIARAGFDIYGIDLSTVMLEIAEKRIAQLSPEIRSRIHLRNMDMSNFQLGRKFGFIFIADNSFSELKTEEKQLSCLRCAYRHLRPDGKFLVTVRRFDPGKFKNGRIDTPWSKPFRHPTTREWMQRKVEMQLTEDGKSMRQIIFYKTTHTNGSETVDECSLEARVMLRDDYISLFSHAGFSTNVFVGYEEQEDDGKNPILCFVCDRDG